MNRYNKALSAPSVQTVLPAMTMDGRIYGFYPIAQTTFDGTETSLTLPSGVAVPLKVVTVDTNVGLRSVTQYMAAVWPIGLAANYKPWAALELVSNEDSGAYNLYSMPAQGWIQRFSRGTLISAIRDTMNQGSYSAPSNSNPTASNAALYWKASVKFEMLLGDSAFFDFNWMTVFGTSRKPVRIQTLANPAPIAPTSAVVTGSISGSTLTVSAVSTGTLSAGCVITGAGISPNTIITGIISAPGGGVGTYSIGVISFAPGSYTVAASTQTVSSTTITATFTAFNPVAATYPMTSTLSPVPPATFNSMRASVIGIPQASADGPIYDTVRLLKLGDIPVGSYVFMFRVFDTNGLSTDVVFTLNVT